MTMAEPQWVNTPTVGDRVLVTPETWTVKRDEGTFIYHNVYQVVSHRQVVHYCPVGKIELPDWLALDWGRAVLRSQADQVFEVPVTVSLFAGHLPLTEAEGVSHAT